MSCVSSRHETGPPKPVLWDNPEGYNGGGRWEVNQDGEGKCIPVADVSVWQNLYNIVK